MNVETFGGRKFLISLSIIIFTFLLILFNRIAPPDYLKIVLTVIGIYTGLNVYQKQKTKKEL